MNKVLVVEEAGVGVEVVGWERGMVGADRGGGGQGEGREAGARGVRGRGTAAWEKDGGSSRDAFRRFLSDAGNLAGTTV